MSTQKLEDIKKDQAKIDAEDLAVDKSRTEDIKGGPIHFPIGDVKGGVQPRRG